MNVLFEVFLQIPDEVPTVCIYTVATSGAA